MFTPENINKADQIAIPYNTQIGTGLWCHVMLASPLAHVELLGAEHARIFGKGVRNRSGLLSRLRLRKEGSRCQVQISDIEVGAALVLYGGQHGWETCLELRIHSGNASVWSVDDQGMAVEMARTRFQPKTAQVAIHRLGNQFTCCINETLLWSGSLPFDLPPARILLRAIGDLHNEGRECSAIFGQVHICGQAAEKQITGQLSDESGKPIADGWLHIAGDPFAHARSDNAGLFSLQYTPTGHDTLIYGAAGRGFSMAPDIIPGQHMLCLTDEPQPRPEYPRPDFARSQWWQNLNGVWDFAFADAAPPAVYPYLIRVPYPWTSLMAVGEEAFADDHHYTGIWGGIAGTAWYRRKVRIAADFPLGNQAVLHFGAVNHQADVYWDGKHIGRHEGGYAPFEITLGMVQPGAEHELAVRVYYSHAIDPTDIPMGKQGWWFSHAPGIWQTVWLEARSPKAHVVKLHACPLVEFTPTGYNAAFTIDFAAVGDWDYAELELYSPANHRVAVHKIDHGDVGGAVQPSEVNHIDCDVNQTCKAHLSVTEPQLWSPESPALYTLRASLYSDAQVSDTVSTYCGLRQVRCDWAPGHDPASSADVKEQWQYVYLNNQPIYIVGILDQAYNPWGVYTYRAYEPADLPGSIAFDIQAAKKLGYNLIRLHVKQNEPLWLYETARQGLLVWDEIPNYRGAPPGRGWELWQQQVVDQHLRDFNCPSIIIRSLFNESWGVKDMRTNPATQALIKQEVQKQRAREPHRLVVDNSAAQGYPNRHVDTDINDEHVYLDDWWEWIATLNSVSKHIYPGSSYNFHNQTHELDEVGDPGNLQQGQPYIISEFSSRGCKAIAVRMFPKIAGFVKINLADQEWERFSALTYARQWRPAPFINADLQPLNDSMEHTLDAVVIAAPPTNRLWAGGHASVMMYIAAFHRTLCDVPIMIHTRLVGWGANNKTVILDEQTIPCDVQPFTVSKGYTYNVYRPKGFTRVTLFAWTTRAGQITARNACTWS